MRGTPSHLYPYALLLERKSPGRSGKRQHPTGSDLQIIIRFRYRTSNLIFFLLEENKSSESYSASVPIASVEIHHTISSVYFRNYKKTKRFLKETLLGSTTKRGFVGL